ncbi:MAG: hypothetical protein EBS31_07735 [Burkholderiaceae bacterium]|nr:hypothetical protein [Burkholderiaceae bacterium]
MHVLQRIAVQAENKDYAFGSVKEYLENQMGDEYNLASWYDWFVTGGGWNPNTDGYDDNDQSMTVSYDDNPKMFLDTVKEGIEARMAEFNTYRKHFNEKNVDINSVLDKYDGQMDFGFPLYELSKLIDMLHNSYFYDMHHETTNTKYMLEDIDKGNKNWYIVFVDFHF